MESNKIQSGSVGSMMREELASAKRAQKLSSANTARSLVPVDNDFGEYDYGGEVYQFLDGFGYCTNATELPNNTF